MTLSTGSLLAGRYEITAPIATGGMGEVWKARDRVLDRVVAAKVLRSEYTGDPSFLARFRNEARHTAALTHPNIASVYDYGETVDDTGTQQLAFLVMEFVEGQPLVSILHDEGRLPVDWTLHVLSQSADGLSAAHRAGVVHRDIKPGNLMVRPDGVVKLTDFGIAQARDATPLTKTGMVVGTAQYLSPEQAQGLEVNAASDVYSLGVVAYECLSGARPFDGASQVAIALAHINRPPPPLPAEIPPAVRLLVERALAKDPADRFPDGGAFAEAIRRVAAGGTLAAAIPLNAPATTPTQVVGGAADGRTQVFAAPAVGAAAGGALGAGSAGPRTGGAGPMPPLQAPSDDDDWGVAADDPPPQDRRRKRLLWLAVALVVLLLLGVGAWLLLSRNGAEPADSGRTTAPVTTSAGVAAITLDPDAYIGKDGAAVEKQLDGMGLDASRQPATESQIADADQNLAVGEVAAVDPANTPLPQGAQVVIYVVPADDGGGEQPSATTESEVTTTPPATTTAAPTTQATTAATTTTAAPTTTVPPTTTAGGSSATTTTTSASSTDPVAGGTGVTG
ncbi:MAG: pknA [Blastococcus sp.]|nr:pknA [Blastococcus sp.]